MRSVIIVFLVGVLALSGCSSAFNVSVEMPQSISVENDSKDDANTGRTSTSVEKEDKTEAYHDCDGTWYAQDETGMTLLIEDGIMTLTYDDIDSSAAFKAKTADDRISFVIEDELFFFYEVNYFAEEDKIEAYTWPILDDDGGYKRTVFKRDVYEPGDTIMLGLLQGDWEIMDDGEMIQEPGIKRDIVHFSAPDYHMMRFIRPNGDKTTFTVELTDVFEGKPGMYDRMTLSNRFTSGQYSWDEVRPEQSFQILIANNLGTDYMMLRELGDERTGFASDGLRYDRSSYGTWFFRRPNPYDYDGEYESDTTTPSTVGIEDDVRIKGTSFYAFKWAEFGNSCTLQRVEVFNTTVTVDGKEENAMGYIIPNDEYAYSAVNYEYKGMQYMASGGYFDPCLVKVVTDEAGQIIEMVKFAYALDGFYLERGVKVFESE